MKTVRRSPIKAFSLLESILVMLIVSVLLLLGGNYTPVNMSINQGVYLLKGQLLYLQTDSLLNNKDNVLEINSGYIGDTYTGLSISGNDIYINGNSNVNMAQTIYLYTDNETAECKLWLGTGRLVYEIKR